MEQPSSLRRYTPEQVALAQRLFQEYYAACFWYMRPDLIISEATVPLVIDGLRKNGGMDTLRAAAQLEH